MGEQGSGARRHGPPLEAGSQDNWGNWGKKEGKKREKKEKKGKKRRKRKKKGGVPVTKLKMDLFSIKNECETSPFLIS